MASSVLLGWLCLRHAMASKAPFMAGLSFNFHRSSPMSVLVQIRFFRFHFLVFSFSLERFKDLLLLTFILNLSFLFRWSARLDIRR
ncbi:hypothetical protein BRARA_A01406 [Brassica rapa]|uniref:Secreted protein n=1 Tax=Brassica campestris TaxID=3711 RepID=A0A398ATM5_BRACM|nr:hypothetical protein BRARA_A01406 [Brassica rapa]